MNQIFLSLVRGGQSAIQTQATNETLRMYTLLEVLRDA